MCSERLEPFFLQLLDRALSVCERPGALWTKHPAPPAPIPLPDADKEIKLDHRAAAEWFASTFRPAAALSDNAVPHVPCCRRCSRAASGS